MTGVKYVFPWRINSAIEIKNKTVTVMSRQVPDSYIKRNRDVVNMAERLQQMII